MAWIVKNAGLNQDEMDNNAREMYAFFSARGFTVNAIAGMLGNAVRESTVNPGAWQNYKVNYNLGYGLFQHTPAYKLIDWLKSKAYPIDSGEGQCERVIYEKETKVQYYSTANYPLSFSAYAQSIQTPEYLARAWFANYERGNPAKAAMETREHWARYYYNLLSGEKPQPP